MSNTQGTPADIHHGEKLSAGAGLKSFSGWRLIGVLAVLSFGLELATIETSITATALVSISDFFDDSLTTTWVVLGYLLSYMGFSVIFARLSDGIGRQEATVIAWLLFGIFSLAGGLATTLKQLIGFRVLQGIGGSGLYSMVMVIGPQITPAKYWGLFSAMIGFTLATGSVLGPILGGAITTHTTWRWIYLFNAPGALVGILWLLLSWPRRTSPKPSPRLDHHALRQVDYIGALLLLAASTLLVFALQEAGATTYLWNSPTIISTLVISGASWIAFFAWISWLSFRKTRSETACIFPLHIALTRPTGPAIIAILCSGFPYFVTIINLPQRFQVANGDTPIMAGVHLLPLLCSMALGSGLGGAVSVKKNFTSHTLIVAACLILLGCGLMSTLKNARIIDDAVYGYQFILGLGTGLTFSSATMMTSVSNKQGEAAAAQGAISQARILGGSIGLATATILLNHKLSSSLSDVLVHNELHEIQRSFSTIRNLQPDQQATVARLFSEAFNDQMRACTYVAAICLLASIATFQVNPPTIEAYKAQQEAAT